MRIDSCPPPDILVDNTNAPVFIDLYPKAYERIDKTKIDRTIQRKRRIVIDLTDMDTMIEFRKNKPICTRPHTKHLRLETRLTRTTHLSNTIVYRKITLRTLSLSLTVTVQSTLRARTPPALLDNFPHTPLKNRNPVFTRCRHRLLHQSVRPMHRAYRLHRRDNIVLTLSRKPRRLEHRRIEQLNLIASKLMNMSPANTLRRLRQYLYRRTVYKLTFPFAKHPGKHILIPLCDKTRQVFVHS